MLGLVRHASACPRFSKISKQQSLKTVELFCLFVACCYTSMEATVLSCGFSWVWSNMSSSLKQQITSIFRKDRDFVDFLQAVICLLLDICWSYKNMLFWAGIVRYSLSANQIVRYFKLKKLKKDMRYQVDFLLPLNLEEILYYFGWWPQNTLGQSVFRIFYFWLVWLVKLNTGGLLLHCTCLALWTVLFAIMLQWQNVGN